MNVGQLIAKLEQFPKSRKVVVSGYEDGFDEPIVKEVRISPEPVYAWYNGIYDRDELTGKLAIAIERKEHKGSR